MPRVSKLLSYLLTLTIVTVCGTGACAAQDTVYFPSADGRTEIVGYVFKPDGPGPFPAIVMLHGRAGPYSSRVSRDCALVQRAQPSPCNAASLSQRHLMWGNFWSQRGILAIHVDSFGPRGAGHGFGRSTHDDPQRDSVNERAVRPLDADGALAYLRTRSDVRRESVALQGWSNGASTALNVMYRQASNAASNAAGNADGSTGFAAALVFYPGCGPAALLSQRYQAGAPLTVFLAADDEEVSAVSCRKVLSGAPAGPGKVDVVWYDGATHGFDDPGRERQSVAANQRASIDAIKRSADVIGAALMRR